VCVFVCDDPRVHLRRFPHSSSLVVDRSSCPLDAQVTSLTHAIANDVAALSAMAGSSAQVAALTSTAVNDIIALSAMTQLAVEENRELKLKVADQDQELRDTKQKLADIMLELERSRMATEDARGAMVSNFPAPGGHHSGPFQSWREFANRIYREYDHLTNGVLVTAGAMISAARADIRVVTANNWGDGRQAALAGALTGSYNVLTDVERVLRADDSDSGHSDSDSEIAPESAADVSTSASDGGMDLVEDSDDSA